MVSNASNHVSHAMKKKPLNSICWIISGYSIHKSVVKIRKQSYQVKQNSEHLKQYEINTASQYVLQFIVFTKRGNLSWRPAQGSIRAKRCEFTTTQLLWKFVFNATPPKRPNWGSVETRKKSHCAENPRGKPVGRAKRFSKPETSKHQKSVRQKESKVIWSAFSTEMTEKEFIVERTLQNSFISLSFYRHFCGSVCNQFLA